MDVIAGFFEFLWLTVLLLAPMLLLGLFLSGLMHVFISRAAVLRLFRREGLGAVASSAAIGVPMPLCSCSVVPVVAEMHRKGASRSACMSFLITAPETGADSILVTNAFFGPVVAVVRPIVSFVTAVASGLAWIGLARPAIETASNDEADVAQCSHLDRDCDHEYEHESLFRERDDCYVSLRELGESAASWVRELVMKPREKVLAAKVPQTLQNEKRTSKTGDRPDFLTIVRHIFRYGFIEIADDILFALLVGVLLGGLLYFALPTDLMAYEYANWLAYPVMVLIGVPLYICASASTPIAAALVAKGVSPGAALVFLMTGPATNTGTIAIILSNFGARFATIYVTGVIVVTVVLGIMIDLALLAAGWSVAVNLDASDSPAILTIQWTAAAALILLIIWRFRAGALQSGFEDMMMNLRPAGRRIVALLRR